MRKKSELVKGSGASSVEQHQTPLPMIDKSDLHYRHAAILSSLYGDLPIFLIQAPFIKAS